MLDNLNASSLVLTFSLTTLSIFVTEWPFRIAHTLSIHAITIIFAIDIFAWISKLIAEDARMFTITDTLVAIRVIDTRHTLAIIHTLVLVANVILIILTIGPRIL